MYPGPGVGSSGSRLQTAKTKEIKATADQVEVEDGAPNINICSSSHDIFTHTHIHSYSRALTGAKALNIDWQHEEHLARDQAFTHIQLSASPSINKRLRQLTVIGVCLSQIYR